MAHYMRQDLFNELVVTVLWIEHMSEISGKDSRRHIDEMLDTYNRYYQDDDFEKPLWRAVQILDEWLKQTHLNDQERLGCVEGLRRVTGKYHPDGRRKRKWLLNGLWFTSSRSFPPDREGQCVRDLALYHTGMMAGRLPAS